ncbi:MAG: type II toxin-antitoxin system PemK/MazF family toxin [Bdellovibrionales bacterium]
MVNQFDVYLIALDPTLGSEIKKTRPCLIVSPNEMNQFLNTVLIAPMTTTQRPYPTRVKTAFQGKKGDIALDQLRAVDKKRLVKPLGTIHRKTAEKTLAILQEMFS